MPCTPCLRFFARFKCAAATHGECDCPKCQGYCRCEHAPWLPANGGSEQPFRARNGHVLLYMWCPSTGDHAYYDQTIDRFLSNDELSAALQLS